VSSKNRVGQILTHVQQSHSNGDIQAIGVVIVMKNPDGSPAFNVCFASDREPAHADLPLIGFGAELLKESAIAQLRVGPTPHARSYPREAG
jgi:hypothetical protein